MWHIGSNNKIYLLDTDGSYSNPDPRYSDATEITVLGDGRAIFLRSDG
jgi:hypothetical protein